MDDDFNSAERKPGDYILFALAFIGFMIAISGVVVAAPGIAIFGSLVLLGSLMGCMSG